ELLPNTARIADKLAIIRSMTSPLGEHGLGNRYLLSRYQPSPALDQPSYGAVLAHVRGERQVLPPFVSIPESRPTAGAGFLGSRYDPCVTAGDAGKRDCRVRDLDFHPEVTAARLERRRDFLTRLDRVQRGIEAA